MTGNVSQRGILLLLHVLLTVGADEINRSRSLGAVHGPLCYNCHGIQQPNACTDIKICSVGEVCMLHQMTSSSGAQSYEASCQSDMMCKMIGQMQMTQIGKRDGTMCHVCCHGDFCNNKCNSSPQLPTTTVDPRLTCYSCSLLTDPSRCGHHVTCQLGQMCVLRESGKGHSGETVYEASCENKEVCHALTTLNAASYGDHAHSFCYTCCSTDLCNNHCEHHGPTTSSTIATPTHSMTAHHHTTAPPVPTIPDGSGLRCYSCNSMSTPNDCNHLVTCAVGEVCSLSGMVMASHKIYQATCQEKTICLQNADLLEKHFGAGNYCKLCCETDACNTHCHVAPPTRPPTAPTLGTTTAAGSTASLRCFSCNTMNDPDGCRHTVMCGHGQVCMLLEHLLHDPNAREYSTSCQSLSTCNHYGEQLRTAAQQSGREYCHMCCTKEFCNRGCIHHVPQTGTPTVHIPTTPSTGAPGMLMCYSCSSMNDSTPCHHAIPCLPGEVCMIHETGTLPTGLPEYSSSCEDRKLCQVYSDLAKAGKSSCHTCCDSHLCNTHCHDNPPTTQASLIIPTHPPTPQTTQVQNGPLECYSCSVMRQPNECSSTAICDFGQVCMLHETVSSTNGMKTYKASCERNLVCETVVRLIAQGGTGQGHVYCTFCCSTSRCNNRCSTPTAHPTSVPSTTTKSSPVVNGAWSPWSHWSSCSRTCGSGGQQTRSRQCDNPVPQNGGANCHGVNAEHKSCLLTNCPINGGWSTWDSWSGCSVSCGPGGHQTRNRQCDNPRPQYNGSSCHGNSTEYKQCQATCPINGEWSDWGSWSVCSQTCGHNVVQLRVRSCTHPQPLYGGHTCIGQNTDTRNCTLPHCPVDGAWSSWSSWSTCSTSCGSGGQQRSRTCSNPKPQYNGHNCIGDNVDHQTCNLLSCPVDGAWSSWSTWSSCTQSCGSGGQHIRTRSCTNPPPQHHGRVCIGNSMEHQVCQMKSCSAHQPLECYSCPIIHDPKSCSHTEICDADEVCMLHETTSTLTTGTTYAASCERKLICERVVSLMSVDHGFNGHVFCTHCCNTSRCNNNCHDPRLRTTLAPPTTTPLTPEIKCQQIGYSYVHSIGFCFKIHGKENTYSHDDTLCKQHGGTLAVIDTDVKMKLVLFELNLRPSVAAKLLYIGGRDTNHTGRYYWPDGSSVGHTLWAPHEPMYFHDHHVHCLVISASDKGFRTDNCQTHRPFVCTLNVH